MATFTNMATLSYSGKTAVSNTVVGELVEALSITKTAIMDDYVAGDDVTFVVTVRNTSAADVTDVAVTDNLGAYPFDAATLVPLTYVANSLHYYANGVLQATPTVSADRALTVAGLTVPAGGNIMLIYEAQVNQYAPLEAGSTITNTATVAGSGITTLVAASAQITTEAQPQLTISKTLTPATVEENGQLTYTFVIQNAGNTAATAGDNVVLSDTFTPILSGITATLNGAPLASGSDYTYGDSTGLFTTVAGVITVPAATYTQNADGVWTTTPGTTTLVVTGTV